MIEAFADLKAFAYRYSFCNLFNFEIFLNNNNKLMRELHQEHTRQPYSVVDFVLFTEDCFPGKTKMVRIGEFDYIVEKFERVTMTNVYMVTIKIL